MKLNTKDLYLLSQCAISAACQAGLLIAGFSGRNIEVSRKSGGDNLASQVVTEVDYMSQDIIVKTLSPACEIYGLALLTEESADDRSRLEKDFFWSIDPLDGTLPFTESRAGYSVSIALVSRTGEACLGVIYDPLEKTLYHAVKGSSAYRNSLIWKPDASGKNGLQPLTIITDRSFIKDPLYDECMSKLHEAASASGYPEVQTISFGGAAMNACWVLENRPACYFKFPRSGNSGGSLWDYAASASIVSEAGAIVSDIYGNPLDLNRPDSTFMNHRGIFYASDQQTADVVKKVLFSLDWAGK